MSGISKVALHFVMYEHLCLQLLPPKDPPEIPEYLLLPVLGGHIVFYPSNMKDKMRDFPVPELLPLSGEGATAKPEEYKVLSAVAGQ